MAEWSIDKGLSNVVGGVSSGFFSGAFGRDITFTYCEKGTEPMEDYGYYMVSTERWEECWKLDDASYLPVDISCLPSYRFDELNKAAGKIRSIFDGVSVSGLIKAPHLYAPSSHGLPKVNDGRHRIWVIRHLGISAFLAAIPFSEIDVFIQNDLLC